MGPSSRLWSCRRPSPTACRACFAAERVARFSSSPRPSIALKTIKKLEDAETQWKQKAERISRGEEQGLWEIFLERGMVKDIAGVSRVSDMSKLMREKRIGAYVGFDPTAPSLHAGHLVPLMPLFWMYMHGYLAITLVGGATAKFGDPTGRTTDREPVTSDMQSKNLFGVHFQLKKMWSNVEAQARRYGYQKDWAWRRGLLNNSVWHGKLVLTEFLRLLGKGVRVGPMLGRDTVKEKLDSGNGLSFAELSYTLMQGWDWWELYKQRGVMMQIGGSDQFGNIVQGTEAVKTIRQNSSKAQFYPKGFFYDPVGFTVPLLTNSAGQKIGKSSGGGNLWLDPVATSAYDLYGHFVRQPDADMDRLLKLLTFIPTSEIRTLLEEHVVDKSKRLAQHRLAFEVLYVVHGREVAEHTQREHQVMHGRSADAVSFEHSPGEQITLNNAPSMRVTLPRSLVYGDSVARILYAAGLAASISEGHRLALQKAVYIGGRSSGGGELAMSDTRVDWRPVKMWQPEQTQKFLIGGNTLMLRKGKHNIRIIEVVDDVMYAISGQTYPGQPGLGKTRLAKERLGMGKTHVDILKEELAEGHKRDEQIDQLSDDLPGPPPSNSKLMALRKQLAFFSENFDAEIHPPNCQPEKLKARIQRLEKQQELFQENEPEEDRPKNVSAQEGRQ